MECAGATITFVVRENGCNGSEEGRRGFRGCLPGARRALGTAIHDPFRPHPAPDLASRPPRPPRGKAGGQGPGGGPAGTALPGPCPASGAISLGSRGSPLTPSAVENELYISYMDEYIRYILDE